MLKLLKNLIQKYSKHFFGYHDPLLFTQVTKSVYILFDSLEQINANNNIINNDTIINSGNQNKDNNKSKKAILTFLHLQY